MGLAVTSVGEEQLEKKELKKHAATIHCSNSLSLLQRKISNALLYHAYPSLLTEEEHRISIKQLCQLIAYAGNNHSVIKEALRGLLGTLLEWNVVNDATGIEDWTASSILACVSLQGPTCYYAYSPRMKQLLYSPSMFGKIDLYVQSRFKSNYGLALYENCIRYRGLPFTKWFEIDVFRKIMGVAPDHYTVFRDFKKRVLDKSVEEVNTYSDLLVESEVARERRRVVRIRFSLKERIKKTRLGTAVMEEMKEINAKENPLRSQLMRQFTLSQRQADKVLKHYSHEFISEKIEVVEASKNYQQGRVKNLAAYFISALKEDYQKPTNSIDKAAQKQRDLDLIQFNLKELKSQAEKIEKTYTQYREKTIDEVIEQLGESEKKDFMEQFHCYAASSIKTILQLQRKRYSAKTILNSPQIKGLLRQFAIRTLPILQENLIPIEKFLDRVSEQQREAWYQYQLVST